MTVSVECGSMWEDRIQRAMGSLKVDRLPVVVELSGVPKVGKTAFADSLTDLFRKVGCTVAGSPEAAAEFPIADRWGLDFSAWTVVAFIKRFLELKAWGGDVMVADRGLFDAVVWLRVKAERRLCDPQAVATFRALACEDLWWSHLSAVLVFVAGADEVLRRAGQRRIYTGDSAVTTPETLAMLRPALEQEAELWNRDRRVVRVLDVGGMAIGDILVAGAEEVVAALEAHAQARGA